MEISIDLQRLHIVSSKRSSKHVNSKNYIFVIHWLECLVYSG